MALYNNTNPERLTKETEKSPKIIGDVFIHESAVVDPSAVLGPNVSIGKNVRIGAGARIRESIVLGRDYNGIMVIWSLCIFLLNSVLMIENKSDMNLILFPSTSSDSEQKPIWHPLEGNRVN